MTTKPVLGWLQSLLLRKFQRIDRAKLAELEVDAVVLLAFLSLVDCSQADVNARSQEKRSAAS